MKGASDHVSRIREAREKTEEVDKKLPDTKMSEKVRVRKGTFTFTFIRVGEQVEREARVITDIR